MTEKLHEKASQAMMDNKNDLAEELYIKILEINPIDEIAHQQLMEIYENVDKEKYYIARSNWNISQGKIEYAINDCKKALGVNPESVISYLKLARLHTSSGKNLQAIDCYTRIIAIDEKAIGAYFELADVYNKEDSATSAIDILLKCEEHCSNKERKLLNDKLAQLYLSIEDYENALSRVEDEFLKVKILIDAQKLDRASEELNKIDVQKLKKEQKPAYYRLLAELQYSKKDYENALLAVENYVNSSAPDPVSYQMKALIYDEMGDEFKSYYNWGYARKAQGKLEEAIVEFTNAHRINSKDKNTIIELANLLSQTGEKYASIDFWKKDYELDGNSYAKNILADFYYEQGDYKLAAYYGKEIKPRAGENAQIEEDEGLIGKIMKLFGK